MACSLQTARNGLLKLNNFSTSTAQEPIASPINSSSNQLSTLSAWQQWPFLHNRDFILRASGSSVLHQHLRHSPPTVTPNFYFFPFKVSFSILWTFPDVSYLPLNFWHPLLTLPQKLSHRHPLLSAQPWHPLPFSALAKVKHCHSNSSTCPLQLVLSSLEYKLTICRRPPNLCEKAQS